MALAPSPAGGRPLLAIDGESLTVEEVVRVARGGEPVKLSHLALTRVEAGHAALLRIVRTGKPVYGVTTGFGQLENVPISKADLLRLQENLVRSHAAGAGPPLHVDDVRASILIRANALAKGYSGVRHEVVDLLLGLLKDAEIAASMSFEGLRGSPAPFDARLARLKKQVGQHLVAGNMVKLLRDSEIVQSHKGPHRVQDPYSLRCIPQVLGACFESIHYARQVLEIEINSATDNPLIFPDTGESLSGGNFHGQSLAMALDFLGLGLTVLGAFSERRTARLVDPHLSELPPFLTEHGGLQSGMMVLPYTAAAPPAQNKGYAHPASADSIPASANQEDHNSMGQGAALKARQILENARRIVAIEYLCAAQGLEFRKPLKPGVGPQIAHRVIRGSIPKLTQDRPMSGDIDRVVGMMRSGDVAKPVEAKVGRLA